jgi:peptide/nickel transport system substrate-binding protein
MTMRLRLHALSTVTAAGVLLAALPLAGCGTSSGEPSGSSTLRWGIATAPRSLDPAHAFDGNSMLVSNELLEPLVSLDPEGKPVPRLAESWRRPDPLTYVYELRSGVTFWDGKPLTAEDVVYSIDRHRDPKVASELAGYLQDVASVKATGPLEVTIRLSSPAPEFGSTVALVSHTVEKAFAVAHGDTLGDSNTLTMGTGPYRVTAFSPQGVTLKRNDDYWGSEPAMAEVSMEVVPDAETLRLALDSGEIDGTFGVPPESSRSWDSLGGVSVKYVDAPVTTMLSLDVASAPWNDIHLRRAVAYAIDREAIVRSVFDDHARVADSIVDPQLWGSLASKDEAASIYEGLQTYGHDPQRAKAELAASQHPGGVSFALQYPASNAALGKALQVIKADLADIGITLTLKEVTPDKWLGDIYAHQHLGAQMLLLGADYPDPAAVPRLLLGKANATANGFNLANFSTPEMERLLTEERSSEPGKRVAALTGIMRIANDELPYIPLYYGVSGLALSKHFTYGVAYSYWVPFFQEWASDVRPAS